MNLLVNLFFCFYILCFFFLIISTYIVKSYDLDSYNRKNIFVVFLFLIAYTAIPAVTTLASVSSFLIKNYHFPGFGRFLSYNEMALNYLRENYFSNFKITMVLSFFISSIFMFGYINNFFKYAKLIDDKFIKYDILSKFSISILSFGILFLFECFDFISKQNKVGTIRELEEGNDVIRDYKQAENRLKIELSLRDSKGFKFLKNFKIPKHIEVLNLLIIGGMGSGKTFFIIPILLQFFVSRYPSLILDNKGDFCELLGEDEDVTILSPFDARSPVWDVSEDIATELEAIEFVSQLIPLPGGSGDFFAHAARDIALGAIKFLQVTKPYNWHMNEVLEAIASEEILRVLEKYHPGGLQTLRDCGYDPKSGKLLVGETSASILQNVRAYLKNFEILSRAWPHKSENSFSIKRWVRGEEKNTLFLIVPFKQLYPEISGFFSGIVIDLFVNQALNLPDSKERRIGLFLDELGAIPRVKSLANGAKLLRSKGVCMFVGIQEVGVIRKKYELDGGTEVILNAFSIKLIGRAETPEYAEYFVRLLGKNRYKKITRSRSISNGRYSLSLSEEQVVEDAVSSGELMSIPPANAKNGSIFFLKMSEIPVIFKLQIITTVKKGKYLGNIEPDWMKRPEKEIKLGLEDNLLNQDKSNINIDQNLENMLTDISRSNNIVENEAVFNLSNSNEIKKENEDKKINNIDGTITLDLESLNF